MSEVKLVEELVVILKEYEVPISDQLKRILFDFEALEQRLKAVEAERDDLRIQYKLADGEKDDVKRHATLLADALSDINNDIGEVPEVKICFADVSAVVDMYAGLITDEALKQGEG